MRVVRPKAYVGIVRRKKICTKIENLSIKAVVCSIFPPAHQSMSKRVRSASPSVKGESSADEDESSADEDDAPILYVVNKVPQMFLFATTFALSFVLNPNPTQSIFMQIETFSHDEDPPVDLDFSQSFRFPNARALSAMPPPEDTEIEVSVSVAESTPEAILLEREADFPVERFPAEATEDVAGFTITDVQKLLITLPPSLKGKDLLLFMKVTYRYKDTVSPTEWVVPCHWPPEKTDVRLHLKFYF